MQPEVGDLIQPAADAGIAKRLDRIHRDRRKWPSGKLAGEEPMERTAQCHCGSLRVIASGEPERVYLCHCKACQRRTGTAFHFGTSWLKGQVRIEGERKIY